MERIEEKDVNQRNGRLRALLEFSVKCSRTACFLYNPRGVGSNPGFPSN